MAGPPDKLAIKAPRSVQGVARGAPRPGVSTLLHTKFVPPQRRGPVLQRARLLQRLCAQKAPRLTLVTAPAGYGKTELLAQWHKALKCAGAQLGWLSLETTDNDPARFVSHLLAAIGKRGQQADGPGAPPTQSAEALSDRVLHTLSRRRGTFFLFLDDQHLLVEPVLCAALSRVLALSPATVHFVVASREMPPLPLERLRAQGELNEVNWSDLSFTPSEGAAFMRVLAPDIATDLTAALVERTEGWAAGLQLASLSHQGSTKTTDLLDRLHGSNRQISGFLAQEVFAGLSDALRQFLLCTSVLGRFCVELCNALTGRDDGAAMLDELERRSLFIFALDERGVWFRYHHLFAEFLERELRHREPARAAALHRKAAGWHEHHGNVIDAIEHAFAAQDAPFAGSVLNRHCDALIYSGHMSSIIRYAQRLPEAELRLWPLVQLNLAWAFEYEWHFDRAREVLDAVRTDYAQSPAARAPAKRLLIRHRLAHREMMLAFMADDFGAADAFCRRLQASDARDDAYTRASVHTVQICIRRAQFDPAGAMAAASRAHPLMEKARSEFGEVLVDTFVGPAYAQVGDYAHAIQCLERALERAGSISGANSGMAAIPGPLLAQQYYERGAADRASDLLARYSQVMHECRFVDSLIAYFSCSARLEMRRGNTDAAMARLDEGLQVAREMGFARLRWALLAVALALYDAAGDTRGALQLARSETLSKSPLVPAPGGHATQTEFAQACAGARLALLSGRPAAAVPGMVRWKRFLDACGCVYEALNAGLLLTRLQHGAGDARAAQRELRLVLNAAQRLGLPQLLLDEGPGLREPLEHYALAAAGVTGEASAFAFRILGDQAPAPAHAGGATRSPTSQPTERLGAREAEVLNLAGQGLRNQDIALTLGLSENTVKWHLKQVYAKLAVGGRAEAVRRARSGGLIP